MFRVIRNYFPQLKNLENFKKLNSYAKENLSKVDFIFLLSLMIVDGTDNTDYFIYKFNLSKKDQKRLKSIDFFYKENVMLKILLKKTLIKFFIIMANKLYLILLILNYLLLKLKKNYLKLIEIYKNKIIPTYPIRANTIMAKYNIPEGKILGNKLKVDRRNMGSK